MLQQPYQQEFQTETLTEYMPIERKVIEYETVTRKIQVPVVEDVIDYVPVHTQHHQYSPPREQITIQPQITHYVPSPPKIVHRQVEHVPIQLHQSKLQQQVQAVPLQQGQIIQQRPVQQWQQQYQPQILQQPQVQQLPYIHQGIQQQFLPFQHHNQQIVHQRHLQPVQQIPQPQILQRPINQLQPIPSFQQQTFAPQNFIAPQVNLHNPVGIPQFHTSVRPEELSYQYNQQPKGPTPQFYNMSEQKAQQQFKEFQQYQQKENFQPQPRPYQVQFDPEDLQEDSNRSYQPRKPQGVQFEDDQVSEQSYPHQPAQVINNLPQDRDLQRQVYQDATKRTLKREDYFKDKVFL